jgi:1-acyl-sn-glycerol-3-phosphate acyltransferase
MTRAFRVAVRGAAALVCVLGCLGEYGVRAALRRLDTRVRARVLARWSARLLAGIGVSVAVEGELPQPGLIVSNHLSYLDILVFSAVAECVFVSKREIKAWPGIGWISSLAGSIYIDRALRAQTHTVQPEIEAALSNGIRLVLFPEGTSSDGSSVMRFHSSLFQPALDLDAPITAAAIDYSLSDGDAGREACYWGDMTLLPHLLNLLTKRSVQARLKFSREHRRFRDRKEAARTMHNQVGELRSVSVAARA